MNWFPWGEEAFAKARAEDKPSLLSVGYATCPWCHVMERESFEDVGLAHQLADGFVAIKVDREELPDVDHVYMSALQALTGSGGWPMSMFLTPQLRAFFGGTYFPPRSRQGIPSFSEVLAAVREAWVRRWGDIEREAQTPTSSRISRWPGGVIKVVAYGAGAYSVDNKSEKSRRTLAVR